VQPIRVVFGGLRLRGREFPTPDALVAWFKVHFKEPIPRPVPRAASPLPEVPHGPAGDVIWVLVC
jgi:hypothetical protein